MRGEADSDVRRSPRLPCFIVSRHQSHCSADAYSYCSVSKDDDSECMNEGHISQARRFRQQPVAVPCELMSTEAERTLKRSVPEPSRF